MREISRIPERNLISMLNMSTRQSVTKTNCAKNDGGVSAEAGKRQRGLLSVAFGPRCYQMVRGCAALYVCPRVCAQSFLYVTEVVGVLQSIMPCWLKLTTSS